MELSKTFRFESAHRLAKGYIGKCANIHGHSWNGSLIVSCESMNEQDMGVDYAELGKFLKKVEKEFDHKLLLQQDDQMVSVLQKGKKFTSLAPAVDNGIVIMEKNPTSEALAEYIFNWAVRDLSHLPCKVVAVKINETCTTECTWKP